MILGMFVRHFKTYENINFIPVSSSDPLTAYIWENGVGKSSVLETLDTFFNDADWKVNSNAKNKWNQKKSYISPIFLLKQTDINFNPTERNLLEKLSLYFRNIDSHVIAWASAKVKKELTPIIWKLKSNINYNDYYLFWLSLSREKNISTDPFTIKLDVAEKKVLKKIYWKILDYFSYIYIPVELPVEYVVNFKSKQLESLMNKEFIKEIDSILKSQIDTKWRRKTYVGKKIIDIINDKLEELIIWIESDIHTFDSSYSFKSSWAKTKNITASHLREIILESYLRIRRLKKWWEDIKNLSSWEQRKSMLDIVSAFLMSGKATNKKIIFAIDEPESSMHMKACLSQFEMIYWFSPVNQIIFTTHRYWFLPTFERWEFHHLVKSGPDIEFKSYDFDSYLEQKRDFPDDIQLKSVFDLVSSIMVTIRSDVSRNRLLCEWSDDKLYLESHLPKMDNLRILPVWWCSVVNKVHKYLVHPILDKSEKMNIKWKVLSLVDTDDVKLPIDSSRNNENLSIFRLQKDWNEVRLVKNRTAWNYSKTHVEDSLDWKIYYRAIFEVINSSWDEIVKQSMNKFKYNDDAMLSSVEWEDSILRPTELDYKTDKWNLLEFILNDRNKYLIAKKYFELSQIEPIKEQVRIDKIVDFFSEEETS